MCNRTSFPGNRGFYPPPPIHLYNWFLAYCVYKNRFLPEHRNNGFGEDLNILK